VLRSQIRILTSLVGSGFGRLGQDPGSDLEQGGQPLTKQFQVRVSLNVIADSLFILLWGESKAGK
jgi:hypothetical protein